MQRSALFQTLTSPIAPTELIVEGNIPDWLNGQLLRIGVGNFDPPQKHWFDGEGFILSADFCGGKLRASARLLDLPKIHGVHKGRFGKAPPKLWDRLRGIWTHKSYFNSANTALLETQGRTFALYEGAIPSEFNPETLEFMDEADFSIVRRSFSAHPKRIGAKQISFGFRIIPKPSLDLYELPDIGAPRWLGAVPYNGSVFVHDFAVTSEYAIFILSPVFADPYRMIVKGEALAECLYFDAQKNTEILVVPLSNPKKCQRYDLPPFLYTHTASAQQIDDEIVIDGICYADGSNLEWIRTVFPAQQPLRQSSAGELHRIVINLREGRVSRRKLFSASVEVPTALTAENPFLWAAGYSSVCGSGHGLYNAIFEFDRERGTNQEIFADSNTVVSELLPITNPTDPNAPVGIAILHDLAEENSSLAVFSLGKNKAAKCLLAKAKLPRMIPFTFHGIWRGR